MDKIYLHVTYCWGWGSNATIPTVLQAGWTRGLILVRAGDFIISNYVQMNSEPHSTSMPMDAGIPS